MGEVIQHRQPHVVGRALSRAVVPAHQQVAVRALYNTARMHVLVLQREDQLTVSKITLNETVRRVVPNDVPSVIRAVSELGASYPDVAQFLIQAENQSNLISRLEFDALPRAGRVYLRPSDDFTASYQKKSRIGRPTMAPNIFNDDEHTVDPDRAEQDEEEEDLLENADLVHADGETSPDGSGEKVGQASFADVSSPVKPEAENDSAARQMPKPASDNSVSSSGRTRERLYPSPVTFFKRLWN